MFRFNRVCVVQSTRPVIKLRASKSYLYGLLSLQLHHAVTVTKCFWYNHLLYLILISLQHTLRILLIQCREAINNFGDQVWKTSLVGSFLKQAGFSKYIPCYGIYLTRITRLNTFSLKQFVFYTLQIVMLSKIGIISKELHWKICK
jgi:hypothetical protein